MCVCVCVSVCVCVCQWCCVVPWRTDLRVCVCVCVCVNGVVLCCVVLSCTLEDGSASAARRTGERREISGLRITLEMSSIAALAPSFT